jgi:hypothetical protein
LTSQGLVAGLITSLLQDARLWGYLRELFDSQVTTFLESFMVKNWKIVFEENMLGILNGLEMEVKSIEGTLQERLINLNAISQELIQLVVQACRSH